MIDTAALREKVLDLAIRGKLVPQDPNDEPASVLLERIHEQKLQMVREGKLKAKDVKDDTIIFKGDDNCYYEKYSDGSVKNIQDEIPFELPAGWAWVRFGTFSINRDSERKPIALSNRKNVKKHYDYYGASGKIDKVDKYIFNEKLLLIGEDGANLVTRSKPIAFFAEGKYWVNNHAHCIDSTNKQYLNYLCCYINAINLEKYITGSAQPKMNQDNMNSILISVPPYLEQERILKQIDSIFNLTNEISINYNDIDTINHLLRSKILELAIQGKLVPQDENNEPASVLLERIRAERKAKLGKKYVESYIFKGDDNCYYENMPKNWVKCRLSDIADLERGITFSASAKETIKTKKNIACIRTANVQDELDLDDLIYVDRAYTKNNERKLLRVGDIIMSSANSKELVGKSCIVKHFDGEMTFGGFVLVIRSIQIIPEFLLICLKYLFLKGAFYNESTQTTNIANISTKIIESLEISLPPLMEQQRIINKITTLFNILKDGV